MPRPSAELPDIPPDVRAAAQVHIEDVERARLLWRRDAPTLFKDLLDAEIIE